MLQWFQMGMPAGTVVASSLMPVGLSKLCLGLDRESTSLIEVQTKPRFDPDATRKAHDKPAVGRPCAVFVLIM